MSRMKTHSAQRTAWRRELEEFKRACDNELEAQDPEEGSAQEYQTLLYFKTLGKRLEYLLDDVEFLEREVERLKQAEF